MSNIHICPLDALPATIESSGAKSLVSFASPGMELKQPAEIKGEFLSLAFNDINKPRADLIAPNRDHISDLIRFVRRWNKKDPIIFQCWMGISRSTAAGIIALATLRPFVDAQVIANVLREASPTATPNPLMIDFADQLLGRGGALSFAVATMGRGENAATGEPFELSLNSF